MLSSLVSAMDLSKESEELSCRVWGRVMSLWSQWMGGDVLAAMYSRLVSCDFFGILCVCLLSQEKINGKRKSGAR